MSIGAILIGAAMMVLTMPFVINPLLNPKQNDQPALDNEELDIPGDRYSELLLAIRDLEFDHQIGKITEEDYSGLRDTLLAQAAIALEAQEKHDAELDAQLEQAIQLRREKKSMSRVCSHCGMTLEPNDRFCRACGKPVEATCLKCGGKLQPNDLFCNSCGTPIAAVKTQTSMEGTL